MPKKAAPKSETGPAQTVMMRLPTEVSVIERATKRTNTTFRHTLAIACDDYLDVVCNHLIEAGVSPSEDEATKYQVRPVALETHKKLDEVAKRTGVSRAMLIRCCLVLQAKEPKHVNWPPIPVMYMD